MADLELAMVVAGGFLACIALLNLAVLGWSLTRIKRVRQSAGSLLLPPVRLDIPRRSKPSALTCVPALALMGILALLSGERLLWLVFAVLLVVVPLMLLPMSFFVSGPGARLELRQNGLVIGGTELKPWSAIQSYRWKETDPAGLHIQLRHARLEFPISEVDREAVDRVLAQHVQGSHPAPEQG